MSCEIQKHFFHEKRRNKQEEKNEQSKFLSKTLVISKAGTDRSNI